MYQRLLIGIVLGLTVSGAWADVFVETFDSGNEGGWTFGPPGTIEPSGGNPGKYLASGLLDTFAPQPRTSVGGSVFSGDYRAAGVTSIGLDLITFSADTTAGRPLTLMLIHDNQTPGSVSDDTAAYFLGPNIPHVGEGWKSYDYDVPSDETSLPSGWQLLNLGDVGAAPDHTWDEVIQSVSRVQYFYGDPTFVFIFQQWFLGLDNPRIAACGETAGAVPDGGVVSGTPLSVRKTAGDAVILRWGKSCEGCDTDYGIYQGPLDGLYDHDPVVCSTGGATQLSFVPRPGDVYFLAVPSNTIHDGSYGRDSAGDERPPATSACLPQQAEVCR